MAKTPEGPSLDTMLVLTRTAIGLGIGMLLAERIRPPFRNAAAIALVTVGAISAIPFFVKLTLQQLNRPESERGSNARLRSIRSDSGYRSEADAF